jgi:hypothetical protein
VIRLESRKEDAVWLMKVDECQMVDARGLLSSIDGGKGKGRKMEWESRSICTSHRLALIAASQASRAR